MSSILGHGTSEKLESWFASSKNMFCGCVSFRDSKKLPLTVMDLTEILWPHYFGFN